MKILITGATGFIGQHLLASLAVSDCNYTCVAVSRDIAKDNKAQLKRSDRKTVEHIAIGAMGQFEDWQRVFNGVDVIIHLAAKVHYNGDENFESYYRDNRLVVQKMACAAIAAGVKRFIFLSSIKASDFEQYSDEYLSEPNTGARTTDYYAQSKAGAEKDLLALAASSLMEVVIIRPPLVYGPGVKANFLHLMHIASGPYPLPFAAIDNKRDMISVFNLCDLIIRCIDHPKAKNQTFSVSDGVPYSLAQVITSIRKVKGRNPRLFFMPLSLLTLTLAIIGKAEMSDRLFGDLTVDTKITRQLLDWQPAYTMEQTLQAMEERF